MKELIYRRGEAGYRVDRVATDLPKAMQASASSCAMTGMPQDLGDEAGHYYRQFRMNNGGMAVGVSYKDPFGNRKSALADILFTADRAEALQLVASYPMTGRYFLNQKRLYAQTQSAEQAWAALNVSVPVFAGDRAGELPAACRLLKGVFGDQALLASMFAALLDVASNNPRMILLFGPEEKPEDMAEHGRSIIEALFACIPPTAAIHIGYIAPADTDDRSGNAMFGIRYSRCRDISEDARPYAYTFDLTRREGSAPAQANSAAADYAADLAGLVFQGDRAALDRIRELRRLLDSPALFDDADVPGTVAMFHHLAVGADELSEGEAEALLDWRHATLQAAKGEPASLDALPMWPRVEQWTRERALGRILSCRAEWKQGDRVNCAERLREILEDGDRLHRLGRPEAQAWRKAYAEQLSGGALLDEAVLPGARRELIRRCAEQAADPDGASLYWPVQESWLFDQWKRGALVGDGQAAAAVGALYARDPVGADRYIQAEADNSVASGALRAGALESDVDRAVFARLLEQRPDFAIGAMETALKERDPFDGGEDLDVWQRWQRATEGNPPAREAYLRCLDARVERTLSMAGEGDVPGLLEELETGGRFSGTCAALGCEGDVNAKVRDRVRALAEGKGVYPYYPDQPAAARSLANLLGGPWPGRLDALEQANALSPRQLTAEDLDRAIGQGWLDASDEECLGRVRTLMWRRLRADLDGAQPSEAMLTALALHNYRRGTLDPKGMLKDAEAIGVSRKKLESFCRKAADAGATRGLPCVARILREGVATGYPAQARRATEGHAARFAGIPTAVAAAAVPVFALGAVACLLGVLSRIGLL